MSIIGASLQVALGSSPYNARVVREFQQQGNTQAWFIVGNVDGRGRSRFCNTSSSLSAGAQASAVLTQLRA